MLAFCAWSFCFISILCLSNCILSQDQQPLSVAIQPNRDYPALQGQHHSEQKCAETNTYMFISTDALITPVTALTISATALDTSDKYFVYLYNYFDDHSHCLDYPRHCLGDPSQMFVYLFYCLEYLNNCIDYISQCLFYLSQICRLSLPLL